MAHEVEFGPFRFDREARLLRRGDEELLLPQRALALLGCLVARAGHVIAKDELLSEVWPDAHVTEASLTEAISVLRETLGDTAQRPEYIQTVHRRGYRFVAPIANASPADAPLSQSAPLHAEAASTAADVHGRTNGHGRAPVLALATAIAVLLTLAFAFGLLRPRATPPHVGEVPAAHFSVQTEAGERIGADGPSVAISPDGRRLVYVVVDADGISRLRQRWMHAIDSEAVAGTEGARGPFFSPDGASVGFFAGGTLKRVRLDGTAPLIVCEARHAMSGAWGADDVIVFSGKLTFNGLWRVSANGGTATPVTTPDAAAGEVAHLWPAFLPDGRSLLFTSWSTTFDSARLAILSLDTGRRRDIFTGGSHARYVTSGHVIFNTADALVSAPFDLERGIVGGPVTPILGDIETDVYDGLAHVAVSASGNVLAYVPATGDVGRRDVIVADRHGDRVVPTRLPPRFYRNVKIGPDDRAAVTILDGARSDIWIADVDDGALRRLTFDGFNIEPVWTPDGRRITYASTTGGAFAVMWRAADGSGRSETLVSGEAHSYPMSWSPDGKRLLFTVMNTDTGIDLFVLHLDGHRRDVTPFRVTPADEIFAAFSPDGRWVAYSSNDAGREEIYLEPFPTTGARWQISMGGGSRPVWSPDGREIFFLNDTQLMATAIELAPAVRVGMPQRLAPADALEWAQPDRAARFVLLRERTPPRPARAFNVATNWLVDAARVR